MDIEPLLIRTESVSSCHNPMLHLWEMNTPAAFELPPPFDEAVARHERELMRFLLRTTRKSNSD